MTEEQREGRETLSRAGSRAEVPEAPRSCPRETAAPGQRLGWCAQRREERSGMCRGVCRCSPPLPGDRAVPSLSCIPRRVPEPCQEEGPRGLQANIVYAGAPGSYHDLPVPPLPPRTAVTSLCAALLRATPCCPQGGPGPPPRLSCFYSFLKMVREVESRFMYFYHPAGRVGGVEHPPGSATAWGRR